MSSCICTVVSTSSLNRTPPWPVEPVIPVSVPCSVTSEFSFAVYASTSPWHRVLMDMRSCPAHAIRADHCKEYVRPAKSVAAVVTTVCRELWPLSTLRWDHGDSIAPKRPEDDDREGTCERRCEGSAEGERRPLMGEPPRGEENAPSRDGERAGVARGDQSSPRQVSDEFRSRAGDLRLSV